MHSPITTRLILSGLSLAALSHLYGCTSPEDSQSGAAEDRVWRFTPASANRNPGAEPISTIVDARPAALVNGIPVTWGELRPYLNDLAGAKALEEVALDRRINDELTKSRIIVTLDDAVGERKRILESFSDNPNDAIQRMNEWRTEQNLGDARFEALLLRKAGLRALVRSKVALPIEAATMQPETVMVDSEQDRMDQLAADLLGKTTFSVFDEQLKESWQRHKKT